MGNAWNSVKNFIFGEPLESWPEMASAVASRQIHEPERMKGVNVDLVSPMERMLYNLMGNSVYGAYNPITGKLKVDRKNIEKDKMTNDSSFIQTLLEHELTHADQKRKHGRMGSYMKTVKSMAQPYEQRPLEREALDAEGTTWRKYRTQDISLPRGK